MSFKTLTTKALNSATSYADAIDGLRKLCAKLDRDAARAEMLPIVATFYKVPLVDGSGPASGTKVLDKTAAAYETARKALQRLLGDIYGSVTPKAEPKAKAAKAEAHATALAEQTATALSRGDWAASTFTGTDASNITTLMDTGAPLEPHALLQAEMLEPGAWFRLVHDGQETTVQLAWQSAARQLYLFVSATQHAFLLQQGRVAQYLQAQLLLPVQSESLVQQASRRAVQVLEAQPERLLA